MAFKVGLLKFADNLLGRVLVCCLSLPRPMPIPRMSTILLVRPGGIGDAALLSFAIAALHKRFPDAVVDVLAEKRNAQVFEMVPGVRDICRYDDLVGFVTILCRRYDVVIDTEQWYRLSAVFCRLVRSTMKIGFDTNMRRRMFTHPVSYSQDTYEALSFIRLLQPLGISVGEMSDGGTLLISEVARQTMQSTLQNVLSSPILALFPSASIPEKRWELEKIRQLVEWCERNNFHVVVLGGIGDRALCKQISAGHQVLNLAGKVSLAETAAVLQQASIVVSGDSGVLHLAFCLGRPTVSLFGPSNVVKWAPRGKDHAVIQRNLTCSPCSCFGHTPKCPYNIRCMKEIPVEKVTAAVRDLLHLTNEGESN